MRNNYEPNYKLLEKVSISDTFGRGRKTESLFLLFMGKVLEIGISKNKGDKIVSLNDVGAIKGKGLVGERHFKENNEKRLQITLIEIENSFLVDLLISDENLIQIHKKVFPEDALQTIKTTSKQENEK